MILENSLGPSSLQGVNLKGQFCSLVLTRA
jgi:hypothetical protein